MKIKVMVAFGTRPEAIKMAPIIQVLNSKVESFETTVCVTGQHKEMLEQVLKSFNIVPDINLSIMRKNQDLFDINIDILAKMKNILVQVNPDIVLVHGDTTTTFATSLACFYLQIKVGHVEAGLRTYNTQSPFPEEFNRQAVGIIADLHFAPTENSRINLINEGKDTKKIFVTGNTAIDALQSTVQEDYYHPLFEWVGKDRLILITAHRRENIGTPMRNMFSAVKRISEKYDNVKFIYPVHLNPKVREIANEVLGSSKKIKIIEPLNVIDFHNFIAKSYLVLTDSGGIQEEAPSLGIPVLVMRDTTERPEGVQAGTLKLVGIQEDNIYQSIKELLENESVYKLMSETKNPYGDGTASQQIIDKLLNEFDLN